MKISKLTNKNINNIFDFWMTMRQSDAYSQGVDYMQILSNCSVHLYGTAFMHELYYINSISAYMTARSYGAVDSSINPAILGYAKEINAQIDAMIDDVDIPTDKMVGHGGSSIFDILPISNIPITISACITGKSLFSILNGKIENLFISGMNGGYPQYLTEYNEDTITNNIIRMLTQSLCNNLINITKNRQPYKRDFLYKNVFSAIANNDSVFVEKLISLSTHNGTVCLHNVQPATVMNSIKAIRDSKSENPTDDTFINTAMCTFVIRSTMYQLFQLIHDSIRYNLRGFSIKSIEEFSSIVQRSINIDKTIFDNYMIRISKPIMNIVDVTKTKLADRDHFIDSFECIFCGQVLEYEIEIPYIYLTNINNINTTPIYERLLKQADVVMKKLN